MKVVLFCGGLGLRMRAHPNELRPKSMTPIGGRPVLWHIMRYYAHFGHTEFIICLGFGAEAIKNYFLGHREALANPGSSARGRPLKLLPGEMSDWRITFVDTGLDTPIGERLRRVRQYLGDDEMFLANYGDVLTDAPLAGLVDRVASSDAAGGLLAVVPQESFHVVDIDERDGLTGIGPAASANLRINGGYFVLRQHIFDYLNEGDDLVMHACARAARAHRFKAIRYDGFWAPMDTLKERIALEEMYRAGTRPWAVWEAPAHESNSEPDRPELTLMSSPQAPARRTSVRRPA